jgi:multicomponent Na+:H+ antiporter subunit D
MWIPAFILVGSIIEGIYYIRLLVKLWNPGNEGEESSEKAETSYNILNGFTVSIIALVVGAIFVIAGITPEFLVENIEKAANSLGDINAYLSSVMGGI